MTHDLSQAVQGVYNSSREIMKNKQRHLYISMLDLLTRTTRASGVSSVVHLSEDNVKFWYSEILPLVFDEDRSIQDHSITALETVLLCFETADFENHPDWPMIKTTIVEEYSKNIHDLRQAANSNWYKIWCLLVRILNKEILKGATVINTFLSIVEMGFRSNDYTIRADAFICWKVLVEIFAKHGEIFSPKRIKLVCIPLKSSQSKTLETSVNKFKAWWYFLCKLAPRIDDYVEIYESFLTYCFGPSCKQMNASNANVSSSSSGQGKVYLKVKQMAIACLIESLGQSTKEVAAMMNSIALEHPPCPLITKSVMSKCGQTIVAACFEATLMACEPDCKLGKQAEIIWKNLCERLIESQKHELYFECLKQLKIVAENENFSSNEVLRQCFIKIIDGLARIKEIPITNDADVNATKISEIIIQLIQYVINSQVIISNNTVDNIAEVCSLKDLTQSSKYWAVQKKVISFIMSHTEADIYLKLSLWRNISMSLIDYLKQNVFEFRIEENYKMVNEWIMWPLRNSLLDESTSLFKGEFFEICKNLMESASVAEGKSLFTECITKSLRNEHNAATNSMLLVTIFRSFLLAMDVEYEMSTKPTSTYEFINHVLSDAQKFNKGNFTTLIEALTTHVSKLQEDQIVFAFPELKAICATIIEKESSAVFAKHSAEHFKRVLQDKLKSNKAKEKKLLKEIKDLMRNDSTYVIIPTVWSMNPDKLTEHQKEKMKEKRNDIPAMYNDISQSQDSSIKPWTPKKIVIAKSKNSPGEIVLENNIEDRCSPVTAIENEAINAGVSSLCTSTNTVNEESSVKSCVEFDAPEHPVKETQKPENGRKQKKPIKRDTAKKATENKTKKNKQAPAVSDGLLDKLSIKVDANNKTLLRQLKAIEIDTVEGNTVVKGRFRERRSVGGKEKSKQQTEKGQKKRRKESDSNEKDENAKDGRKILKSDSLDTEKESDQASPVSNGETKSPTTESNESIDEVVEASQPVSESVLSKKVAARKSISSVNNNNNVFLKPANRDQLDKTIKVQQNTSISPQKENSSPNVEETIAETQTTDQVNVTVVENAQTSIEKTTQQKISEAETQLNTEAWNKSFNGQPLQCADISLMSPPNVSDQRAQSPAPTEMMNLTTQASPHSVFPQQKPLLANPGTLKVAAIESVPVSEQETQLNTQHIKPLLAHPGTPKVVATEPVPVSEQETLLNTQPIKSVFSADQHLQVGRTDKPNTETIDAREKQNDTVADLNCSIRSSPECKDAEERNSEFLNDTLNISPIPNGENNANRARDSDQDRTPSSPVGRKSTKAGLHLPISPPERKPTSNVESPATRPKHIPAFTGRGAQLINLIRNKRTEPVQKPQVSLLMTAKTDEKQTEQATPQPIQHSSRPLSPPPKRDQAAATPQSAPAQIPNHKDLLVFSKVLPSPYASPSASILKRKIHRDSLDEIESPASKRKRVSFHDPPVSVTKEYMKDNEEDNFGKPNLNRCLLPDRTSTPNLSAKQISFKRKSRADSMLELANFAEATNQQQNGVSTMRDSPLGQTSAEMSSLKWNTTSNNSIENGQAEVDERCLTPSPSLYFANEEAVLKHIMEKYQLDLLFDKYTETEKVLPTKCVRSISNKLCSMMKQDSKTKSAVLDILSEQHPREFLDHAIQENLSFVVCERLNYSSIVEFVCEKSKLNEDCRRALLERIQSLLNADKLSADAQQLMMSLLKNHHMSDQEIVRCMKLIMDRHQEIQQMSLSSSPI